MLTARRAACAVAAGLLLYAGHPPWDLTWAGYVALVPLLLLARDLGAGPRPVRSGLLWGLLAGLVFFLPLLTWIGRFGVAPWLLLAAVEALAVGAFTAIVARWGDRAGRLPLAVAAWVGLEWLRSTVPLSGFPWGVLGYTQHDGGLVLPVARLLGVLGVSGVLAAVAASVEAGVMALWRRHWRALITPAVALAVGAVLVVVTPAAPPSTGATVDMAAVQGNDVELPAFVDRGDEMRILDIATRMVAATERLGQMGPPPDVVVWPENALDSDPRTVPAVREQVVEATRHIGDATLLAGTLLDGETPRTFRNTIVRFGPDGDIVDAYDKRILVPFGEYVPWRAMFGNLPPLQAVPNDGIPGEEPKVFDIDGVVVGPVTCYESLYPSLVRDQVREGAEVIVVSTNNASFGRSPASRQHLAFSQLRAVETGRWVMHAGISGISAVVDPDGGLSQQTELFVQALVRADLPLVAEPTPYIVIGDVVGPTAAALTAAAVGWLLWTRRRGQDRSSSL